MTLISKTTLAALMGLTMAACGGSDSAEILTDVQRLENYTNSFQSTLNNVSGMGRASASTMNNASGTATFRGEGGLLVNPFYVNGNVTSSDATLIGTATVNVDFDSGTVGGSVTNLVGANRSNVVDSYTGSVRINNGQINGGSSPLLTGTYSGSLNGNGRQITVRGPLDGVFFGSPSVTGVGLVGEGTSTFGNVNNGTSELVIVADR